MAPDPTKLKTRLDSTCERFRGTIGYSLWHKRYQHRIDRLGDEVFPTASTIKVAVMSKAFEEIDAGRLGYSDRLPTTADDVRGGSGLLQFFKENQSVEVRMLIHLMIEVSDNTATIMLTRKPGTMEVNRHLQRLSLRETRLLALHPPDDAELKAYREKWGMGMCTPDEMVALLEAIVGHRAGSPTSCERMIRIMVHQFYDDLIGSSVPPWGVCATKSAGDLHERSRRYPLVFRQRGRGGHPFGCAGGKAVLSSAQAVGASQRK